MNDYVPNLDDASWFEPKADAKETWRRVMETHSGITLEWGPTDVDRFLGDPKRIAFFMSRYKFAARVLRRCHSIMDVGCGSGMGTVTFLQDTRANAVLGLDFDQSVIRHAIHKLSPALRLARPDADKLKFMCMDFFSCYGAARFGGLACMDVVEHIDPGTADKFIANLASSLDDDGIAVIGTPNKLAAEYGSVHSKIGHINLYSPDTLAADLERSFRHVLLFSMNDEVVHTGFDKLAHYLMAICIK